MCVSCCFGCLCISVLDASWPLQCSGRIGFWGLQIEVCSMRFHPDTWPRSSPGCAFQILHDHWTCCLLLRAAGFWQPPRSLHCCGCSLFRGRRRRWRSKAPRAVATVGRPKTRQGLQEEATLRYAHVHPTQASYQPSRHEGAFALMWGGIMEWLVCSSTAVPGVWHPFVDPVLVLYHLRSRPQAMELVLQSRAWLMASSLRYVFSLPSPMP